MTRIKQPTFTAWLIWSLAALFFLAEYFARVAPSVMLPHLMHTFQLHALGVGTLSAMFYYAYIPMQIPVGALVDSVSSRWLLSAMALLCGAATCLFCSTDQAVIAAIARFLVGFSAAFAFVGALKLAYTWFPARRFGFLAASTQALGMLGAAIGEGPVAALSHSLGWRTTTYIIGGFLCTLAIAMALIIRDRQDMSASSQRWHRAVLDSFAGIGQVLKHRMLWRNAILIGFLYAPTQAFAELWGPSFLLHVYHIPAITAASLSSLIFIGWAIGSPLAGMLSDRIQRRKPILWASIIASFCVMAAILYLPQLSTTTLATLLVTYGISNVGVAISYSVAAELSPAGLAGTGMGFTNMASISVGALLQPLLGYLLDFQHTQQHPLLSHITTQHTLIAHNLRNSMSLLLLCFVISLVACWGLCESYGMQKTHHN